MTASSAHVPTDDDDVPDAGRTLPTISKYGQV